MIKNIILIFSIILILSISCCIGNGDKDNPYHNNGNRVERDSNIIYPNSKPPYTEVPAYYYTIIGVTTEGINLSVYETKDDVDNVLKWYRNKLTASGYDIVVNMTIAKVSGPQGTVKYGMIIFKREDNAIGIWAMREPHQESTIYFICKGPVDKILGSTQPPENTETENITPSTPDYDVEKPQLPSSDKTSGEEPIKRYPNSVMLEHAVVTMDGKKYIYIRYGTERDPEEVFNWYKENIEKEGWNILHTVIYDNTYHIACKRDDSNEVVNIIIERKDYTEIYVEYLKQ